MKEVAKMSVKMFFIFLRVRLALFIMPKMFKPRIAKMIAESIVHVAVAGLIYDEIQKIKKKKDD